MQAETSRMCVYSATAIQTECHAEYEIPVRLLAPICRPKPNRMYVYSSISIRTENLAEFKILVRLLDFICKSKPCTISCASQIAGFLVCFGAARCIFSRFSVRRPGNPQLFSEVTSEGTASLSGVRVMSYFWRFCVWKEQKKSVEINAKEYYNYFHMLRFDESMQNQAK